MPVLSPDITSQWTPADETDNRLELAETEVPSLFALRDTYRRDRVIFATAQQIRQLADRVNDGGTPIGRMVANGGGNGHGHSGQRRSDGR